MNSDANSKIINELEHSLVIPNHSLAMQAAHQGYSDAKEWFDTVTFPLIANSKKYLYMIDIPGMKLLLKHFMVVH